MTIEPTEFDMVALARRGLQVLIDEAEAEVEFARCHAFLHAATGYLTIESIDARETALRAVSEAEGRLARFNVLYPERVAA